MKKSKVFLQMFISYIFILIMPILLAAILYGYTLHIVRSQAEEMNMNILKMIRQEIDYELSNLYKVGSKIATDDRIQYLSGKEKFNASDQFDLYKVFLELDSLCSSEDFISEMFVVLNNTQKVISNNGNMSNELFYSLYYENESLSFEAYKSYMKEKHHGDFLKVYTKTGKEVFFYTRTVINANVGDKSATVCLVIDFDKIREYLNIFKESDDMNVLILTESNDIVAMDAEYINQMKKTGKETILSSLPSEKNSWQYISIIPSEYMEYEAKKVQSLAVSLLFLSLFTGLIFSHYLSKKNYNPIELIMERFKKQSNSDVPNGEDEYQWLNNQIEQFFEKHVDTQRLLKKNLRTVKDYYLCRLLQNYCSEKPPEQYALNIKEQYNTVLLFLPASVSGEDLGKESMEENALHKFTIMNVFEEMCSEYYNLDMVELGERVAAIVSLPDDEPSHLEALKNITENMQQLLEEYFKFSGTILIGPICHGWSGIHESYRQTIKLTEYINLLDATLLVYDEIKDIQAQYYYPVELEQKIVNAIRIGDDVLAQKTMEEIFNQNLQGQITANIYRCLIYGMIGTLLDGANQGGYCDAASELDFPDNDFSKTSISHMRRQFEELVKQICEKIRGIQQENANDHSLSRKVEKYILENYNDPDLNISITSQYFALTPAYLSSAYKKQTGESLLEYINKVRIDNAKRLLTENYSVAEVSEMAGFRDSGTFIRVFKKKVGMTPGQYKKEKSENA